MILPIVQVPDPVLRQVAEPVGAVTEEVRALAADMLETMYDAPGRGLAAPQVGLLKRMFVMDAGWKEGDATPLVAIDPEIVELSEAQVTGPEGCLSIPGEPVDVDRAAAVVLAWTDAQGARQERRFAGFEAICIQHEYDHLDGILCTDRVAGA